jgi:uncharacterized protein HemY
LPYQIIIGYEGWIIDRLIGQVRREMARPLNILDIVVIAVLIILAAVVIYFLRPLVIVLVIIGVGYFIYKWYKRRKARSTT